MCVCVFKKQHQYVPSCRWYGGTPQWWLWTSFPTPPRSRQAWWGSGEVEGWQLSPSSLFTEQQKERTANQILSYMKGKKQTETLFPQLSSCKSSNWSQLNNEEHSSPANIFMFGVELIFPPLTTTTKKSDYLKLSENRALMTKRAAEVIMRLLKCRLLFLECSSSVWFQKKKKKIITIYLVLWNRPFLTDLIFHNNKHQASWIPLIAV